MSDDRQKERTRFNDEMCHKESPLAIEIYSATEGIDLR